jgi:putative heme iron utilization protein
MSPNKLTAPRQHANTGPQAPSLPEPSYAERARTLVSQAPVATLSTMSRKHAGFPFGSLMPYALDESGQPILLISSMAMHTQNLKADAHASLFVEQIGIDGDPLGAARATLVGVAAPVPREEIAPVRDAYLDRHPNSINWVDFADFSFYRLQLVDLYYVGGFGVMGWVSATDYEHASPDPLAEFAAGILEHMNADHGASMVQLARVYAGISATAATMTSVDRLGFWVRLKTKEGMKGARINFLTEVATPEGTRKALIEMVRQAKIMAAL